MGHDGLPMHRGPHRAFHRLSKDDDYRPVRLLSVMA